MNPDECVAMGAAVQGSKLSGELTVSNKVNDILPHGCDTSFAVH